MKNRNIYTLKDLYLLLSIVDGMLDQISKCNSEVPPVNWTYKEKGNSDYLLYLLYIIYRKKLR